MNSFNIQFNPVIFSSSYQQKCHTNENQYTNSTKIHEKTMEQTQRKHQQQPTNNISENTNDNTTKTHQKPTKMKTKKNLKPPIYIYIYKTEHQLLTSDLKKEESEKVNRGRRATAAMSVQRERQRIGVERENDWDERRERK